VGISPTNWQQSQSTIALAHREEGTESEKDLPSESGGLTQLTTASDSDENGATEMGTSLSQVLVEKFFNVTSGSTISETLLLRSRSEIGNHLLSTLKLPFRKDEAWRHTNLKTLFATAELDKSNQKWTAVAAEAERGQHPSFLDIKDHIDESCAKSYLTFVDGTYFPQLSCTLGLPKELTFSALSVNVDTANSSVAAFEESLMLVPDKNEKSRDSFGSDILSALNMANAKDGCIVEVPESVHVQVPLQIINYITKSAVSAFPLTVVHLGARSSLRLKQSYISHKDAAAYVGGVTSINVERGAKIRHTFSQDFSPTSMRHVEVLSSNVMSEAVYDVSILQTGARVGRVNAHVNLSEENANCTVHGVTLAHTRQSLDMHSSIVHDAPSANSEQQQRNLIGDMGLAIFKGRIRIPKHAQLTKSGQLCRSLMLGGRARLVAMPTLEITADNVECSHGASVADLDENEMFYLAARGVNRKEARKLLLRSFALELLSEDIMDNAAISRIISKIETMSPPPNESSAKMSQKFYSI